MAYLRIDKIAKYYGAHRVLSDISLEIDEGEFVVLLGPSGCGKTTLLRVIAGLEQQSGGTIVLNSRDISQLPPSARDYGIVFQSYALFPNLNVAENIGYGIHGGRTETLARKQRVAQMLELVGLPGMEARYPSQLSGGQQQRIAIARALATSPGLLLLDEPLSALDAIERVRLRTEIKRLQKRLGVTTIMVTHDQEEALSLADRIVVMKSGHIEQCGTPLEIYRTPITGFVAGFVGRMNQITGTATSAREAHCGNLLLQSHRQMRLGEQYQFGVRPEDVEILVGHESNAAEQVHYAKVQKIEYLGPQTLLTMRLNDCNSLELLAQIDSNRLKTQCIQDASIVRVRLDPKAVHCLTTDPQHGQVHVD